MVVVLGVESMGLFYLIYGRGEKAKLCPGDLSRFMGESPLCCLTLAKHMVSPQEQQQLQGVSKVLGAGTQGSESPGKCSRGRGGSGGLQWQWSAGLQRLHSG